MTEQPKIELRGIKYTAWASEETLCYQATLYADGVKMGVVGNDGHGGCDHFHPATGRSYGDYAELDKRIAATIPPTIFQGFELPASLEGICAGIVSDWLTAKDFDRAMKGKVLFTKPDAAGLYQVAVKKPHTHAATLAAVKAKNPTYTFLSDLPRDEAFKLYSTA